MYNNYINYHCNEEKKSSLKEKMGKIWNKTKLVGAWITVILMFAFMIYAPMSVIFGPNEHSVSVLYYDHNSNNFKSTLVTVETSFGNTSIYTPFVDNGSIAAIPVHKIETSIYGGGDLYIYMGNHTFKFNIDAMLPSDYIFLLEKDGNNYVSSIFKVKYDDNPYNNEYASTAFALVNAIFKNRIHNFQWSTFTNEIEIKLGFLTSFMYDYTKFYNITLLYNNYTSSVYTYAPCYIISYADPISDLINVTIHSDVKYSTTFRNSLGLVKHIIRRDNTFHIEYYDIPIYQPSVETNPDLTWWIIIGIGWMG